MRKEEIFFDAITNIRENLIEEAQNHAFRRRVQWQRWVGPVAACLVLAAFLSLPLLLPSGGSTGSDSSGSAGAGNSTPSASDQAVPGAPEGEPSSEEPSAQAPTGGNDTPTTEGAGSGPSFLVFNASVLEVRETELLVEPEANLGIAAGTVAVPLEGLDQLPALKPGDRVTVTCTSILTGVGPAQASGVTGVAPLAE